MQPVGMLSGAGAQHPRGPSTMLATNDETHALF
jgi:hypothetical protein